MYLPFHGKGESVDILELRKGFDDVNVGRLLGRRSIGVGADAAGDLVVVFSPDMAVCLGLEIEPYFGRSAAFSRLVLETMQFLALHFLESTVLEFGASCLQVQQRPCGGCDAAKETFPQQTFVAYIELPERRLAALKALKDLHIVTVVDKVFTVVGWVPLRIEAKADRLPIGSFKYRAR